MSDIQKKIRNILDREAAAIAAVTVDDSYERALEALLRCHGKVVATGIGHLMFDRHARRVHAPGRSRPW